jgi:hypothetical protein
MDYQGKTKEQIEFSEMMVGLSILGFLLLIKFFKINEKKA